MWGRKLDYDDLGAALRRVKQVEWLRRKLGSFLGLPPFDDIEIDRALAFVGALTPEERQEPERIDHDTLRRVSLDTGIGITELSMLHQHFLERVRGA